MKSACWLLVPALCSAASATAQSGKAFQEGHATHWAITIANQSFPRLARLPDVSGDGVDDLVAGTVESELAVYSGATGTRLFGVVPAASATLFPSAVADAGDVDRDGVHDIAVGTAAAGLNGGRGAVNWYSGRDGQHLRGVAGTAVDARFGTVLANAGDVDGDGAGDLIVGAPQYGGGRGRAYVVSGANGSILQTLESPAGARNYGAAAARFGDRDGDRIDDLLIGAPSFGSGVVERRAYVLSGATFVSTLSVVGPGDSYLYGISVGAAGDFDGDRVADFVVADPSAGVTATTGGATGGAPGLFEIHSGASGALLLRQRGVGGLDEVGRGGGSADFNGDGIGDVMTSTRLGLRDSSGTLTILAGPSATPIARYSSLEALERFGDQSFPFSDIDGDGRRELVASTSTITPARIYAVAGSVGATGALATPSAIHSGLWYDPSHDGEGFVLEMHGEGRAGVYFFTFDRNGGQRYLLGLGNVVDKRIVFDGLVTSTGGAFGGAFSESSIVRVRESRLVLSFDGCGSGHAEYTVEGVAGSQRITRLTGVLGLGCDAAGAAAQGDFAGSWFDPAHSGEGWIVQPMGPDLYAVLWFSYGAGGTQQWFTAVASRTGSTLRAPAMNRPVGGRFGPYFRPSEVDRQPFGEVRFDFTACGSGTVSWATPAGNGSAPIARLTTLDRVSCVPPP